MKSIQKLNTDLINSIKKSIIEADYNEVTMIASKGFDSHQITVIARGNSFSTPAIIRFCTQGGILIHNHPSGVLEPSNADLEIANILSDMGVSSAIVDNSVENIYFITDPETVSGKKEIDLQKVENIFNDINFNKNNFENYEYRPEQKMMSLFVAKTFNKNNISVIEAGTGTGKSLAYLVPAALWAYENNHKVVISTATLNLQEQLLKKDIPQLKKTIGCDIKTAIIKGRSNYVCRRRIDTVTKEQRLLFEEKKMEILDHILEWYKHTETGCKDEIDIHLDSEIWDNVCSEMDTCSGKNCQHFNNCFVNRARRSALNAHLVLINHHLLCADLSILNVTGKNIILPTYSKLIIDEAHNLDSVAGKHFGVSISLFGFKRNLSRLISKSKRKKGFLSAFEKEILKSCSSEISFVDDIKERVKNITELRVKNEAILDNFFNLFYEFSCSKVISQRYSNTLRKNNFSKSYLNKQLKNVKLRLNENIVNDEKFQTVIIPCAANLLKSMKILVITAEKMVDHAADHIINQNLTFENLARELRACVKRIDARCAEISSILFKKKANDQEVSWFEGSIQHKRLGCKLVAVPINAGECLRKNLFEKIKSIVLTSATITVNHSFDFFLKKMALDGVSCNAENNVNPPIVVKTKSFGSPFDYKKQSILCIPTDIPVPNDPNFEEEISHFIADLITVTSGRALILFTSFKMLYSVSEAVRKKLTKICEKISEPPFDLFIQGSENRHKLLDKFKKSKRGVLFGTASFWEGIDVQGNALSMLIITKLPFPAPDEPLIQAKCDFLNNKGKNSFKEIMLPEAVIKLRQGIGRLIRSSTDFGANVILDKRIISKSYGRAFFESIHDSKRIIGGKEQVIDGLIDFFTNK